MIIEVKAWADFDIPFTMWIGENSDVAYLDEIYEDFRKALVKEFLQSENITEFELTSRGASRIDNELLYRLPDKFISFLERKGFKKVETVKIVFSD